MKVGDRPGARRQRPGSRIARAAATGHRGGLAGEGRPSQWLSRCGLSTPQASGLDSHAGIRGQKDNKSYFSCKRSWTSGEIRAPLYDMPNC